MSSMIGSTANDLDKRAAGARPSLGRRLVLLLVLLLALPLGLTMVSAPDAHAAQAEATGVRVGQHGDVTRFVVDLTGEIAYSIFTLPDPYRVVIDLPEIDWAMDEADKRASGGAVQGLRFGLFNPGNSRIVLDLDRPITIGKSFLLPPQAGFGWRFVLDLAPTTRAAFMRTQGQRTAGTFTARAQPKPEPVIFAPPGQAGTAAPDRTPRKPLIVLDPGHGGVDPGAIGVSGVYEKNITLAAGLKLRDLLEQTGRYRVKLTRDRDIFIPLRQRVHKARTWKADLFVSLHADSLKRRDVRGLSVYTLSETASDKEAAALAERENKADLIAGMDLSTESAEVTSILIDLAQRDTQNRSVHLANYMVDELGQRVKLLRNTHRFAGFAVLKAPDIPSVLMEMGYLSNRDEERLLRTEAYRGKLAESMVRSIDRYFSQEQKAFRP